MKELKIIIAAIAAGAIGFFVWKWSTDDSVNLRDIDDQGQKTNLFIQKIENQTDSLRTVSDKEFSKSFFNDIQAELNTFYSGGFLGSDSFQNEQEYINLSKTLFAVYVPNLIGEAYYKFKQSSWKPSDLIFIRNEIKLIKTSQFFDADSSGYLSEFADIDGVISKYYEIVAFIEQCNSSPANLNYSVDGRFPVDEVTEKIAHAKNYQSNIPDNRYVINVTSLRDELKEIPHKMYRKNFDFLKKQIQQNSGIYNKDKLASQADYSRAIYQPLKSSIDTFDNDVYGVEYSPEFITDFNQLISMLDADNDKAGQYFKKKWDEEMKNKTK